jgi:predicted phosphodiesterase
MNKIQYVSDIHLEFRRTAKASELIKPVAPILALLGDSCCLASEEDFAIFEIFIKDVREKFELILIIPGNHEYYYTPDAGAKKQPPTWKNTIQGTKQRLQAFCDKDPKLRLLDKKAIRLTIGKSKFMIVGTTLWSYIPKSRREELKTLMNDYNHIYTTATQDGKQIIRNITPTDVTRYHLQSRRFLEAAIQQALKEKNTIVILTHHMPYIKDEASHHPGYSTDMSSLIRPNVAAWLYGHTHEQDRTRKNGVLYLSNPKGYQYQRTGFQEDRYLTLAAKKIKTK